MLSYARGIVRVTADKTWEEYQTDENLRLAIERRVEIIGESLAVRHQTLLLLLKAIEKASAV